MSQQKRDAQVEARSRIQETGREHVVVCVWTPTRSSFYYDVLEADSDRLQDPNVEVVGNVDTVAGV